MEKFTARITTLQKLKFMVHWRKGKNGSIKKKKKKMLPAAWKFVCCVFCVLLVRGLCDELITRPEEYYRLWRIVVCD
jgi:hypothetical protein